MDVNNLTYFFSFSLSLPLSADKYPPKWHFTATQVKPVSWYRLFRVDVDGNVPCQNSPKIYDEEMSFSKKFCLYRPKLLFLDSFPSILLGKKVRRDLN